MKKRGIIGFISDFGHKDPYVGICKAVMASINPDALIIDISHMISPHNILQAAIYLWASLPAFPDEAIILAVVDPGVGSERAPIIVQRGNRYLIGPDNGIFGLVLDNAYTVYQISQELLYKSLKPFGISLQTSNTFHARDIFSPAAGLISNGVLPEDFCTTQKRPIKRLEFPHANHQDGIIKGHILYFDKFGNACTSITSKDLTALRCDSKDIKIALYTKNNKGVTIPFGHTFSSVSKGEPVCYINSFGLVEIAVNMGNAQKLLGLSIGDKVRLWCRHQTLDFATLKDKKGKHKTFNSKFLEKGSGSA